MDSLLLPFLVAALAEVGDSTQWLTTILIDRFGPRWSVFAGIMLAAVVNGAIAAAGGALIGATIPFRAVSLLLGLALLLIALGNLMPAKVKNTARDWQRFGPFGTSTLAFLILSFGDKGQLAVAGFAARAQAPLLVALGSAAGVLAANLPVFALGSDAFKRLPFRPLRWVVAALFGLTGLWVALDAIRLI